MQNQLDQRVREADLYFEAVAIGLPDVTRSCVSVAGFPKSLLDISLGTILLTDPNSQHLHQWLLVIVLLDEKVTKGEERIHILL